MRVILATHNKDKANELSQILNLLLNGCRLTADGCRLTAVGWEVLIINDLCPDLKIVEDGTTYAENAQKKARAVFTALRAKSLIDEQSIVLGEDSGLEVDALGGKPGVMSARFGGDEATAYERNRQLLEMMIAVPEELRTARFRCVICLIHSTGSEKIFSGMCEGKIAHTIRGTSGFGYDPIFIPDGYTQTFAELGQTVKNKISHRARAMQQVIEYFIR
ncbi:MAG: RdgB/HAM1 family non-canonical purine NTP pyrophosphatase [candidate division WOR-3 bacterium]